VKTILIVEDKESMAKMLKQTLEDEKYFVITANDGEEGIQRFMENRVDLVISDLRLPKKDGLQVLHAIKEASPMVPFIMMTAFGTIETAVSAVKEGAFEFITKPFNTDHLLILIQRALEGSRLKAENVVLKEELADRIGLPQIISKGPIISHLLELTRKVAVTNTTVLLLGESGTGKELFARAIHHLSPRSSGPFVPINCAAIPKDLLENELFGHERGAFTGAKERKLGKFELADGGTLFLDEISEMDVNLQAKLLRVLESSEFDRVGGTRAIKIDVRVVAASNRNLTEAIAEQRFREDLYYRLNVFPIVIPPLRERREDIPPLVNHFVEACAREMKRSAPTVSDAALNMLMGYPWKGNVRELKNCIERALILCEGTILPEHLGMVTCETAGPITLSTSLTGSLQETAAAATKAAESRMIADVLAQTGGNKLKASKILQVSYKTLLTKIKEYDLEK